MSNLINEARELLELEYENPRDDVEALADVAVRLASVIGKHQKVLDEIKPVLRDRAREVTNGDRYHWTTDAGSTSVTFPAPRWKARKHLDWDQVKRDLGDQFSLFFDTRVSYSVSKDIESRVKQRLASGDEVNIVTTVMGLIEREESTPRVGFKPR